jgi:hypothetical protein
MNPPRKATKPPRKHRVDKKKIAKVYVRGNVATHTLHAIVAKKQTVDATPPVK